MQNGILVIFWLICITLIIKLYDSLQDCVWKFCTWVREYEDKPEEPEIETTRASPENEQIPKPELSPILLPIPIVENKLEPKKEKYVKAREKIYFKNLVFLLNDFRPGRSPLKYWNINCEIEQVLCLLKYVLK